VERAVQVSNCVVWLNDLEHYLGSDGVTREMLARLLSGKGHRIVVATIRAAEPARFSTESFGDGLHTARAVLEMVNEEVRGRTAVVHCRAGTRQGKGMGPTDRGCVAAQ
jgi:hypothetical protein